MSLATIVDAGPLVAFLNRHDPHHAWSSEQFVRLKRPIITCETVLSETCFLLRRGGIDPDHALALVARGALRIAFSLADEVESVRALMNRYRDVGMSLADACLVRMSELHARSEVMTIDRDFEVYRRNGRRTIPLIAPF
ncbi:MAG: PIN domain-containing protein [Alphaproteobacteria bacterium]